MNDPSTPPIDLFHTSACLATAVRRASRVLSAAYDRALAGAGLTSSQFIVLKRLAGSGPVSIKTLATAVGIDRTTLSRTVTHLSARGLIGESSGGDRRVKWLSLTPKGGAAVERAEQCWLEIQNATVSGFGPEQAAHMLAALTALAGAADAGARRRAAP
jgi:DNA-binding MarR family transcriptional regulator